MTMTYIVCLVLLLAGFVLWQIQKRKTENAWLPDELKGAQLVGVEKDLHLTERFNLKGRADRLYRLPDGRLVPVERKSQRTGQLYSTDRLQLSLYGYILQMQGEAVAPFGFVSFPAPYPAARVDLLDQAAVERKLTRYGKLRAGKVTPKRTGGGKCHSCSHTSKCASDGRS